MDSQLGIPPLPHWVGGLGLRGFLFRPRLITALFACVLTVCCTCVPLFSAIQKTQASTLSYVPLDHWSYPVFYRLASLGLIPLHSLAVRPITRLEAQRLVQDASRSLSEADAMVVRLAQEDLRRLTAEFSVDPSATVMIGGRVTNRVPAQFSPARSPGASGISAQYAPSPSLLFFGRAVGGGEAGDPLRSELYASFQLGSVLLQAGRTSVAWGPSFRSNLLLSDNAGTLPLFRLSVEVPRARLTKVVALLERRGGSAPGDILLFATRVDWLVTPEFRLGFNEGIVTAWGGPMNLYHLLQPVPTLTGLMGLYELHDALAQYRHTLAEIDFDWLIKPGVRLYGSVFADDRPDEIAQRRARIGGLSGLFLADPFRTGRTTLRLEYSAVTNGTYSYTDGLQYTYGGRSLGHWLGADGDDFFVELTHQLDSATSMQLTYAFTRHGPGRIGESNNPPPEQWFLSGIVEQRHAIGLSLLKVYSPALEVIYWAEIASVTNRANVSGANALEGSLGVRLTYRWPTPDSFEELSLTPGLAAQSTAPSPSPALTAPASVFPWQLALRAWAPTITSWGPQAGPSTNATLYGVVYRTVMGTTPVAIAYDTSGDHTFWSADLHYPIAQFRDGTVTILGGWGGISYNGLLGGAARSLSVSQPRLGAAFSYHLTFNDDRTPFYITGEIASPPLRYWWGSSSADRLSYAWTYALGAGYQLGSGLVLEAGYRGGAAAWQEATPNQTYLRWDGLYITLAFR